ncbi:hypothetical protein ANO11243_007280 [Dothideomycetidae sp. 11243]|nr:hypothetical protein ANO11243_007280 [fungal sp. No.11243]
MASTEDAAPTTPSVKDEDNVTTTSTPAESSTTAPSAMDDRKARFAALKARNTNSRKANLAETKSEHSRRTTDTSALVSLNRKREEASKKLLRADTEAAGEDFERKRAWDWTIEESEKWDKRMDKKAKHRDDVAFQDFTNEARKIYKRQLREFKPDREAYEQEKANMIERAAQGGGLEIVETSEGELIAVDRDGKFYSTAESTDFVGNKPSKDAIDRLVGDIKKAEEVRLKNRRNRKGGDEDDDVTYINDKNKQFNQKLSRFYNQYTKEIRDSFERGTAI